MPIRARGASGRSCLLIATLALGAASCTAAAPRPVPQETSSPPPAADEWPPPPPAPAPAPANLPPQITASCHPCTVIPGSKLVLRLVASDPDGDPLAVAWRASGGSIENLSASTTTWVAPDTPGRFLVEASVRDAAGYTASSLIELVVHIPSSPAAAAGRGGGASEAHAPPHFPWPPPAWTSHYAIPAEAVWGAGEPTYGAAFDAMREALRRGGFPEWRVYQLDHEGYAIVAHMETIDDQGAPLPGTARWLADPPLSLLDLSAIFRRLATADRGRYRLIVLLCTARPLSSGTAAPETVLPLISSGGVALPEGLRSQPVPSRPTVAALVYEFRKAAGQAPVHLRFAQSGLQARDHLVKALLWTPEVLR